MVFAGRRCAIRVASSATCRARALSSNATVRDHALVCFSSISPFLYKKFHAVGVTDVTGVTTKRSRHADFRLHKTIDSHGCPQQGRSAKTMHSLLMSPVQHVLKVSACCWLPTKWQ